jgi:signal recognition particle subunit SRP19
MVRTRSDRTILWPTYFDSSKTRSQGRRVSKKLAIERPSSEDVFRAVQELGLNATHHPEKAYPGNWWEREGMVSVEKGLPKTELISKVATRLRGIE